MQNIHDKYTGSLKLREVLVLVTKYYRHQYICKLNSADKETHRVKIGTKMNKHEILTITGCT